MRALGAIAQDTSIPPLMAQIDGSNWLPQEAEELRDELFYQRAIHAYMTMQPALNVIGMRDGSEAAFGAATMSCRSGRIGWTQRPGCRRPMPTSSTR
ncbi:MAG: hypothetical protein R3D25_10690 [Geminicoccaceae bacterium]